MRFFVCLFVHFLEEGQRRLYGRENLRADLLKLRIAVIGRKKKRCPQVETVFFKILTKRQKGENLIFT